MLEWRDVWVKGSFSLPFRTRGRHNKSGLWTSFSVKEGVKPEKRGFQPMRKKIGEKFGVVFSLTVVVTDTELQNLVVIVGCDLVLDHFMVGGYRVVFIQGPVRDKVCDLWRGECQVQD